MGQEDKVSIVLKDTDSLDQLLGKDGRIRKKATQGKLKLELDGLSPDQTRYWEGKLNDHYFACGCPQGSVAIIVSVTCFIGYLVLRPDGLHVSWRDGIALFALFIISGAVGKITGLQYSKRQLKKAVFRLKAAYGNIQEKARTS